MTDIQRKYIVDGHNNKVAVQLDLATFEKIEELLENHGLVQLMKKNQEEETLKIAEAKDFYQKRDKVV